jgi:hypothetical protein
MTTQQNKIILVTYENGKNVWYPYTLENMEYFINAMQLRNTEIFSVEIIEQGQ